MADLAELRKRIKEQQALLERLVTEEKALSKAQGMRPMRLRATKTHSPKAKKVKNPAPKQEKIAVKQPKWQELVKQQTIAKAAGILAGAGEGGKITSIHQARDIIKINNIYRDFGAEGVQRFLEQRQRLSSGQKRLLQKISDENKHIFFADFSDRQKKKRNKKKSEKSEKNAKFSVQEADAGTFNLRASAIEIADKVDALIYISVIEGLESQGAIISVALAVLNNLRDDSDRPKFTRNPADAIEDYLDIAKSAAAGKNKKKLGAQEGAKWGAFHSWEIELIEKNLEKIRQEFEPYVD